jgi:small nuclear ribonucleoprotein (snRNP)-like protein
VPENPNPKLRVTTYDKGTHTYRDPFILQESEEASTIQKLGDDIDFPRFIEVIAIKGNDVHMITCRQQFDFVPQICGLEELTVRLLDGDMYIGVIITLRIIRFEDQTFITLPFFAFQVAMYKRCIQSTIQ